MDSQAASDPRPGEDSAAGWTMPALSRAIDGSAILVGPGGSVDFISDSSAEVFGEGDAFRRRWGWVQRRLDDSIDRAQLMADGEASFDVELPADLGGRRLFVRVLPVGDQGGAGYLAVVKDRGALDALQADLRLATQMRRVSLAHQQAAHDIRAPLNAITLNLDMVRRELGDMDETAGALERVAIIGREVNRLARMVQMVMSQSGAPREAARRFDLRRLVREVVSLVRAQARTQGVSVRTQIARDPMPLLAIRDHLKNALVNLVVNALEAMPDGGRLSVCLAVAEGRAELTIADTGEGIPDHVMPKLFKLHFTTKSSGTGIGLYTSRNTIHSLGGRLELTSEEGQGAQARVSLPLAGFEPEQELSC